MKVQPSVMMAFACENVSSEPKSPISFQNVLDGIEAPDFPAPTGRWFAVFCFYSDVETAIPNCRVTIVHESGEAVAQIKVKDMSFTANSPISRNMINFQGFSWPYPGRYVVKFIAGREKVLASFPMLVQHAPAPPEEEETE